jgi:peptidyl-prolyl cis-trans isomerase B (cyclophilin B)
MFGFTKELKEYAFNDDELKEFNYAKFTLENGVIWIKLNTSDVTNTVSNFVHLANDTFYDGLNFHRVIDGFMAQGGCPDGTGAGGPSWSISCETDANGQVHNKGSISMAHAGKDTGGSQFFICFVSCPHLDGGHTVFGNIETDDNESFAVLDAIKQNDKIISVEIVSNRD